MVIIYTNIFCNEALKNKDTVSLSTEKDQTGQWPPDTGPYHPGGQFSMLGSILI